MFRIILLVSILGLVLSSCGATSVPVSTPTPVLTATPDPCSPSEIGKYIDSIRSVSRHFDDTSSLADSTPRNQLAVVISEMQAVRRDAEDLKVPACATDAKDALVAYMDQIITGFTIFLSQSPDSEVTAAFNKAKELLTKYTDTVDKITPK
jgi:hypothetical protein